MKMCKSARLIIECESLKKKKNSQVYGIACYILESSNLYS